MKEVKDFFPMIEFETAQEALLQVFSYLLYEGNQRTMAFTISGQKTTNSI